MNQRDFNTDGALGGTMVLVAFLVLVVVIPFGAMEGCNRYIDGLTDREAIKAGLVQQTDEQGNVIWTKEKP
jgi:hypothetical protein